MKKICFQRLEIHTFGGAKTSESNYFYFLFVLKAIVTIQVVLEEDIFH